MKQPRHFLGLDTVDVAELRRILDEAKRMKADLRAGTASVPLSRRTLAMIFEKPSTRTRVSFDVGMRQLGGGTVLLTPEDSQIGRGETVADTAHVLSRYVDAIMIRCGAHETLLELAANASVPVINGLTQLTHPCQLMADIMTFEEHQGPIAGRTVAWVGDGANNMPNTWLQAAAIFGFELRYACPPQYVPDPAFVQWARDYGAKVEAFEDVRPAVEGVDCVVTDTWVSMGVEDEVQRRQVLPPYRVDEELMALAPEAIFMHCLPAHRGEEVTDAVIDGPRSVVFDEAENRLHAQKAIVTWCLGV